MPGPDALPRGLGLDPGLQDDDHTTDLDPDPQERGQLTDLVPNHRQPDKIITENYAARIKEQQTLMTYRFGLSIQYLQ